MDPTGVFFLDESSSAGREDAYDVLRDLDADGTPDHVDTRFFGGFTCDANGDGIFGPGDSRPYASFYTALFARSSAVCCPPDLNCDGVLNFFDVTEYIGYFEDENAKADFFPPSGGDGLLNFFDVSEFISQYGVGCP